ncbi:hypothetical protein ABIE13_002714 [Ottowia thiooxydans]|uniref:Uncharacterized protein n=1 Tax=Ottowia thiooxydans TaxID=219182 RepID=A0ABV2QAK5_9BURK
MDSPLSRLRAFPPRGGRLQRPGKASFAQALYGLLRSLSNLLPLPLAGARLGERVGRRLESQCRQFLHRVSQSMEAVEVANSARIFEMRVMKF